ncbi:MAG: hypothetical protein AAF829_01135 [Pseudomonadota bacterium]
MKRRLKLLICSIVAGGSTLTAYAGPLCIFTRGQPHPTADTQASPLATQQMTEARNVMCSQFACPPFSFFENNSTANASAESSRFGYTIRYNTNFMQQQIDRFGPGATIAILAHELGHIIDFYQYPQGGPGINREATADRYAGCAFALAGAPEQSLQPFLQSLLSMGPSGPGYPSPQQRAQIARDGYYQCIRR